MKVEFQIGADRAAANLERQAGTFTLKLFQRELQGEILRWAPPYFSIRYCGHTVQGAFYRNGDFVDVHLTKGNFRIRFAASARTPRAGASIGGLSSPMPGKVVRVFVKTGDAVKQGDLLMKIGRAHV